MHLQEHAHTHVYILCIYTLHIDTDCRLVRTCYCYRFLHHANKILHLFYFLCQKSGYFIWIIRFGLIIVFISLLLSIDINVI